LMWSFASRPGVSKMERSPLYGVLVARCSVKPDGLVWDSSAPAELKTAASRSAQKQINRPDRIKNSCALSSHLKTLSERGSARFCVAQDVSDERVDS
jgi:hypothetical protein